MKVPIEWLCEYVDVASVPAEDLARRLTMAGLEVEGMDPVGSDVVLDVSVGSNRPDCLCVAGIAREVAALYGKPFRPAETAVAEDARPVDELTSVEILDEDLCPRYCARVITGVRVGPSPDWMVRRLEAVGLRSINNVVDVTNYVLMELGHPLHAFDYATLAEGRIVVRRAREGETITSLDGQERRLAPDMLVIADALRPVAIAGIMGGADTEVTGRTVDVLLESAFFDPGSIRRTSRSLGMPTEAAYRFERKADLGGLVPALDRAARLIAELAGGKVARGVCDVGVGDPEPVRISLRHARVDLLLGEHIEPAETEGYLRALGISVEPGGDGVAVCTVPSFRRDLTREVDLIEEIARLRGYDSFESLRPRVPMLTSHPEPLREICRKARVVLLGCGLTEVVNFSFGHVRDFPFSSSEVQVARIENPLGEDQEALRPALSPGLVGTIARNIARRVTDLAIFEIGDVFARASDGSLRQQRHVAVALTGRAGGSWRGQGRLLDFYDCKGVVETLLWRLGVSDVTFEPAEEEGIAPGTGAIARSGDAVLGLVGEAAESLLRAYDVAQPVFVAELNMGAVLSAPKRALQVRPAPRFPAALRDMAVVVDASVSCASVEAVIREAGGELVDDVRLFDVYTGKQIPAGRRSLAFSIAYRAEDRTLTDAEVQQVHERIVSALREKVGAELRA